MTTSQCSIVGHVSLPITSTKEISMKDLLKTFFSYGYIEEHTDWIHQFSERGRTGDPIHFYTHPNMPNRILEFDNQFGKYHRLLKGTIKTMIVEEKYIDGDAGQYEEPVDYKTLY